GFGGFGSDSPDRVGLTACAIARAKAIDGNGLAPQNCLVVGDTPLDVAAARGAGAVAVGVASGHYSVEELGAAGADHVVRSLEEALPLGPWVTTSRSTCSPSTTARRSARTCSASPALRRKLRRSASPTRSS